MNDDDLFLPADIAVDRKLEDVDVRVVSYLALLGWHRGERDGRVTDTHAEIGAELNTHDWIIRRSVARIARRRLDLITIKHDENNNCYIVVLFNRWGQFGPASPDGPAR